MSLLAAPLTSFNVRLLHLSILLIVSFNLLGCSQLTNLNWSSIAGNFLSTQIGNLKSSSHVDSTVRLQGKVISRVPFLSGGAYQLEDSSAKIWVTTTTKLPAVGKEIAIEGKVRFQSISLENQEWGELYVTESLRSK
jgi:hypothetical protein